MRRLVRHRAMRPLLKKILAWSCDVLRKSPHDEDSLFWQKIHGVCLHKLGFGIGSHPLQSGEAYVASILERHLPRNAVIFDVGANVGQYAEMIATFFPAAEVFCFEPSPTAFEALSERVGANSVFRVFNVGLGASASKVSLYADAAGSALSSLYRRRLDHFDIKLGTAEDVELTTIDDFCEAQNIKRIDFLKLDTEGHELQVLRGAKLLRASGKIAAIQFEFGGCNIDSRTYFQDFFYELNDEYTLYRILPHALQVIPTYREADEVFITSNYLALHRDRFVDFDCARACAATR